MNQDPLSGNLFAFIIRRATQIRILCFDRSGLCVWAKRLEQGRLVHKWANVASYEMDWTSLKQALAANYEQVITEKQTGQTENRNTDQT
jgi:transposase